MFTDMVYRKKNPWEFHIRCCVFLEKVVLENTIKSCWSFKVRFGWQGIKKCNNKYLIRVYEESVNNNEEGANKFIDNFKTLMVI